MPATVLKSDNYADWDPRWFDKRDPSSDSQFYQSPRKVVQPEPSYQPPLFQNVPGKIYNPAFAIPVCKKFRHNSHRQAYNSRNILARSCAEICGLPDRPRVGVSAHHT